MTTTAIAETAVSALYLDFPWPIGGPKALITCMQGELHMLAARVGADLLALEAVAPNATAVRIAARIAATEQMNGDAGRKLTP